MSGKRNRRRSGSVTARRQTSSSETISYFQRFSARMVRSRNWAVISVRDQRLKPIARGADARVRIAGSTPAPPTCRCFSQGITAEISEFQSAPARKNPLSDANRLAPQRSGQFSTAPRLIVITLFDISLQRSAASRTIANNSPTRVLRMTMAAAIEGRTAEAQGMVEPIRIASVDIFHDLGAAEAIWRASKIRHVSYTPYQRFDFLAAWQRQVGERESLSPFIVVAYDGERRPLLLLPLRHENRARHSHARASWAASTQPSTWRCGRQDFAASATRARSRGAGFGAVKSSRADVLALHQQPLRWRDLPNPMALLPHQPSANDCPLLTMAPEAAPASPDQQFVPATAEEQGAQAAGLAGYRYHVARENADIKRLLDWFFRVKPLRMAEQKLPNVFAEPGVEAFIRSRLPGAARGGGRVIDIHALECDDEVIAIFAGVADGHRFSMMFNTYTMSDNAKYSPGLILMRDIIDHYAGQGYRALDLGIGSDEYKRHVLQGRRADLRQLHPAQPARPDGGERDVGRQPRQASGQAQSGAAGDGAETAQHVR